MTDSADVLLTDGSIGLIRALLPSDGPALHELHQQVSDESYRMRFFGLERRTGQEYVDHVLRDGTLALVLSLQGRVVALATAELTPTGAAEVAFLVEDGHHGQGIGSLLLEHLASAAREQSIDAFEAEVLLDNYPMLTVFTDAGFTYRRGTVDGVATVHLDTRVTTTSHAAADARDRRAEARSLHPLLYPGSVALIGVRRDGSGLGHAVLDAIRAGGFTGGLHVIHPGDLRLDGVDVRPSFADLPAPVDLAVIAVPAPLVSDAVRAAADAGIRCAVVISSGFQELGAEGAVRQSELAALARTRGIRLVGPNCLGVVCNGPGVRLNATFSPTMPPSGGLAVATQSGGVGIVMSDLARDLGLGIGSLVSLGNKADVSGNDLLAAWTDDPLVSAGALYLESFGNAPKFARLARRFAERKPLLAVVGGRSAGGRRAGASHTAAAATTAVGVTALFAQAGVIGCVDAEDLAEAALMLTREPLPDGDRIAVVSNAGGMGVLAADAAAEHRLTLPELSAETRARLAEHVSGTAGTSNPIDAGAGVGADAFAALVEDVLTSGEVDAVLVVLVATSLTDPDLTLRALAAVSERCPERPLVLVTHGIAHPDRSLTRFRTTAGAVRAMGRASGYAAWLAERTIEPEPLREVTLAELMRRAEIAGRLLGSAGAHEGWIGAGDAAELLADYDLAPLGVIARGVEAIADVAAAVGFPVAVKVSDAAVVHRTDRGLVRVGLDSAPAVRAAAISFARELGRHDVSVLVQPVMSGIEMAVGVVRDPTFGPLVMVGAGGVNTDVLLDRTYLLPPVHPADVRRALRGLRCWPLLEGFRGSPAVDVDSFVEIVLSVAALAEDVAEVAEVDLNPVILTPAGCSLIDVKLRLQAGVSSADGPRQLRPR